MDFLGVPGSAVASKTLDLVKQHGFPKEKRLGAGVVDGRSVWSDGPVPAGLFASLQKQVCISLCMLQQNTASLAILKCRNLCSFMLSANFAVTHIDLQGHVGLSFSHCNCMVEFVVIFGGNQSGT